jgi:hypothetical protein
VFALYLHLLEPWELGKNLSELAPKKVYRVLAGADSSAV